MIKTQKKLITLFLAFILTLAVYTPALAASDATFDKALSAAAEYMLTTIKSPEIGSIGGEWAVIGLARSGYEVPQSYYDSYYKNVEQFVKSNNGVLHNVKYTEYSRVILGLTAAGFDPTDVAGYDLTAPLEDFDKTIYQGINGPIWALIALDCADYTNSIRDRYIEEVLRRQLQDGGWNLTGETSDPDMTGMALQALVKYRDRTEVDAAINKALTFLSKTQDSGGGYSSWGEANSESVAQVLVAIASLGISADDERFVKNGITLVDNLLTYQSSDGSFKHTLNGSGETQMSSEQALYALVAVKRAAEGKTSLYDMTDTVINAGKTEDNSATGLPGKHTDVKALPITLPGKTFSDVNGHPNQSAIEALSERGIISGKTASSFDPDATMTRAEFAAITTRALGLPDKLVSVFTDVAPSAWYETAVGTAYYYEIVSGTSATTFNPNGTITRQEAAVMIARAARLAGIDTGRGETEIRDILAQFGDYRTVASWASEALAFCYDAGILDIDGADFDISPTQAIKRCEIAEMLYRMLDIANLL